MGLFSFIKRKNREMSKNDTKSIFDATVKSQEVKKTTEQPHKEFALKTQLTQTPKSAPKLSPIQLDYIKKYKEQTISVLDIPQNLFDDFFCKTVIEINAHAISFVPKKFVTLELCKIAVKQNPLVIKSIPTEFKSQISDYKKLEKLSEEFRKEKDKTTFEEMTEYIPGSDKKFAPDSGLYNAGGSLGDQFEYYREH